MALPATGVIEVRLTGSDTQCAGGFNAARGGTDYTLQDAAQATGTVTSVTTTVTATTSIFTAAMVGNYITDGTTFKEITAFTSATIVTVDSAPSWTAATIYVGGALASPGKAASIGLVSGNVVFVKYNASPYVATAATTNVASGCVAPVNSTTWCGYDTTRAVRNTDTNRPTFQINTGVSTATLFTSTANVDIQNLIGDGNNQTASIFISTRGLNWRCKAINFTAGGFLQNNAGQGVAFWCEASGCSSVSPFKTNALACISHGNSVSGFDGGNVVDCISYANTGGTSDGFGLSGLTSIATMVVNCVAYGNGRDGFRFTGNPGLCVNCIAEANSGFGFNEQSVNLRMLLQNCGSYNNSSGRSSMVTATSPVADLNAVTASSSFFVNAASGNFALNNNQGAGALARAAGFPALSADGLTASFPDVGAAQHQDVPTLVSVNQTHYLGELF